MSEEATAASNEPTNYVDAVVNELVANDGMLVLAQGLGLIESVLARFIEV
jgi:hypothetical protein